MIENVDYKEFDLDDFEELCIAVKNGGYWILVNPDGDFENYYLNANKIVFDNASYFSGLNVKGTYCLKSLISDIIDYNYVLNKELYEQMKKVITIVF